MGYLARELCRDFTWRGHKFVTPEEDKLDELWFCERCGAPGIKVRYEDGTVKVIEKRFKVG